jgi:hypothetical protein
MKLLSYSLFGSRTTDKWLFNFYLRGFVWNVKMNRLLYPGWQTHVELDSGTFSDYDHIFTELQKHYGISYNIDAEDELCKSMLWRFKPVFWPNSEMVLCRDADAITTARECIAVQEWEESGMRIHGINDNRAHQLPLMGGMVGLKCDAIREEFGTWDNFMDGAGDLSKHGSDQKHIMKQLHRPGTNYTLITNMLGRGSDHSNPLWTSDLTCRHIGSAGVVDMETIRFFNKHDANSGFIKTEKIYKEVFYWWL